MIENQSMAKLPGAIILGKILLNIRLTDEMRLQCKTMNMKTPQSSTLCIVVAFFSSLQFSLMKVSHPQSHVKDAVLSTQKADKNNFPEPHQKTILLRCIPSHELTFWSRCVFAKFSCLAMRIFGWKKGNMLNNIFGILTVTFLPTRSWVQWAFVETKFSGNFGTAAKLWTRQNSSFSWQEADSIKSSKGPKYFSILLCEFFWWLLTPLLFVMHFYE